MRPDKLLAGFLGEVFPRVATELVMPRDLSGKADDGILV
jgi:hypothetical protein